jgi:hypothetical protein
MPAFVNYSGTTEQFARSALSRGFRRKPTEASSMPSPSGLCQNPTTWRAMEPPIDQKYVVIRKEDYDRRVQHGLTPLEHHIVTDAVVIRRSDMAAPPIFDAYANFYLASIDQIKTTLMEFPNLDTPALQKHLQDAQKVADYFHEQAVASWNTERHFPTP